MEFSPLLGSSIHRYSIAFAQNILILGVCSMVPANGTCRSYFRNDRSSTHLLRTLIFEYYISSYRFSLLQNIEPRSSRVAGIHLAKNSTMHVPRVLIHFNHTVVYMFVRLPIQPAPPAHPRIRNNAPRASTPGTAPALGIFHSPGSTRLERQIGVSVLR
jgi:hypothetical protein